MKLKEKEEAVKLRYQGISVNKIAKIVGVSKGTVSVWVSNIILTNDQKNVLKIRSGLNHINGAETNKRKAEFNHLQSKKKGFERAKNDKEFNIICALYWGEGHKTSKEVCIANSDSKLIRVFLKWVIKNNLNYSCRLQYYLENGLSENEINKEWCKNVPELDIKHFKKPTICKINRASQNKKIGKLPFGTMTLRVTKSTNLFFEIMGGIDYLSEM